MSLAEGRIRAILTRMDDPWRSVHPDAGPASGPPAWKQNMVVLLLLYPVVFLFGLWVQKPLLIKSAKLPFWLALFVGNGVSVLLLNVLVPRASRAPGWWLSPPPGRAGRFSLAGAALVIGLYAASMYIFSRLS
ncbi:MAG: hypothetical protein H0X27_13275 [Caulobacteraceae bacterium]|nr:hypothetical protein [Caulobacteraceae bacterium]